MCLGLIHAKQISRLLLVDRLDQKEREEYYETPKIHGISTNDIRFMEADKLVNYTLILLYCATTLAATYAICTLGLLIGKRPLAITKLRKGRKNMQLLFINNCCCSYAGVVKRRCELILPWIIFQSIVCAVFAMTLFVAYACPNEFFTRYMGTIYLCRCESTFHEQINPKSLMHFFFLSLLFTGLISLFILFINLICLLLVLKYYKGLKMLKRLTEEVVIPITYRAVSWLLLELKIS